MSHISPLSSSYKEMLQGLELRAKLDPLKSRVGAQSIGKNLKVFHFETNDLSNGLFK